MHVDPDRTVKLRPTHPADLTSMPTGDRRGLPCRRSRLPLDIIVLSICLKRGGAMARPEKLRRIGCVAGGRGFKPIGRPARYRGRDPSARRARGVAFGGSRGSVPGGGRRAHGGFATDLCAHPEPRGATVARALFEEQLLVIGDGPVVEGADGPLPCPVHGGRRRRGRGCRCRHGEE